MKRNRLFFLLFVCFCFAQPTYADGTSQGYEEEDKYADVINPVVKKIFLEIQAAYDSGQLTFEVKKDIVRKNFAQIGLPIDSLANSYDYVDKFAGERKIFGDFASLELFDPNKREEVLQYLDNVIAAYTQYPIETCGSPEEAARRIAMIEALKHFISMLDDSSGSIKPQTVDYDIDQKILDDMPVDGPPIVITDGPLELPVPFISAALTMVASCVAPPCPTAADDYKGHIQISGHYEVTFMGTGSFKLDTPMCCDKLEEDPPGSGGTGDERIPCGVAVGRGSKDKKWWCTEEAACPAGTTCKPTTEKKGSSCFCE